MVQDSATGEMRAPLPPFTPRIKRKKFPEDTQSHAKRLSFMSVIVAAATARTTAEEIGVVPSFL